MTELPPHAGPIDRLRPGALLREWRIGRFVARGAFGQVFEARRASWRADEPPRALKVFDPIMSSAARAALVSEFDMLRRTRHPNLLHGEDAFDVEDGPFAGCVVFVLELADTDLASELGRRGPLPPAELAAIGAHVASGLAACTPAGTCTGTSSRPTCCGSGRPGSSATSGSAAPCRAPTRWRPGPLWTTRRRSCPPSRTATGCTARPTCGRSGSRLWKAATGQHPFAGATPYTRLAAALRGDRAPAAIDPDLAELINCCCLVADPRSRVPAAELAERMDALAVRLGGRPARSAVADRPVPDVAADQADDGRPADGAGSTGAGGQAGRSERPEAGRPFGSRRAATGTGRAPGPARHGARRARRASRRRPPRAHRAARPPGTAGTRPRFPARPGTRRDQDGRPPRATPQPNGAQPPAPAARRSWAERWRRIRIGLCAALAALTTAGIVQVTSLAAAALPFGLTVRRTVYLVLAVAALAGIGWVLRRSGSPAARWSAAAGALLTLLAGTGWLFWGV